MKKTAIILFFILNILLLRSAFGQTVAVTNGLNYLTSSQNQDGSWSDTAINTEVLPATVAVAETLKVLDLQNSLSYSNAQLWLQSQNINTTDFLAERIHALTVAGTDKDQLLSYIDRLSYAWGGYDDYDVNNLDTIVALQAMRAIGYSDATTISNALSYLINNQNPDDGWGFYKGNESNTYVTSIIAATLQQFSQTTALATTVNKATSYLLAHQNTDGGFGSSPSTVYETALAYKALSSVTTDATVLGNAVNYLTDTQSSDGSWLQDPYNTALALQALHLAETRPSTPPQTPTTGTVNGIVVDGATNQPLGSVSAFIQSDPTKNAMTDSTGNFTLVNIPQGNQTITFSFSGYMQSTATIAVAGGSISNMGTVRLSPAATTGIIKGIVTDATTGKPLAAATVTVSGSFSGSTLTGSDGGFTFVNVTPGIVTVAAEMTGYYSVSGTGAVTAAEVLFFNPQLSTTAPSTPTGGLTGKVFDNTMAKPIQNAMISISGGQTATTDTLGSFLITNITPSTYRATVSASGYASQVYQVMIMAGVTTDIQTVNLAPSSQTTTLAGKVTDASTGNALPGAQVQVTGTNLITTTSSDGTYSISGIAQSVFDVRASAIGHDSAGSHVTTAGYGTFAVNFSLNPSQVSNVRITALAADKQAYPANTLVSITTSLQNTGTAALDVLVNIQVWDGANNLLALISHNVEPALTLSAGGTETISLQWDTGQYPPGDYSIILSVVDASQGVMLANGAISLAITPTMQVDGVLPLISPKFVNINSTEQITVSASIGNKSNVDESLTAEYEIKDTDGAIIQNGTVNFTVAPSEPSKALELGQFTYTFLKSGQYPATVRILSGSTVVTENSDAINVSPSIRIEPTKMLSPQTIVPDGDKRIRIDVQIKGVEDQP